MPPIVSTLINIVSLTAWCFFVWYAVKTFQVIRKQNRELGEVFMLRHEMEYQIIQMRHLIADIAKENNQ